MSTKLYEEYAMLKAQAMIDNGELTLEELDIATSKVKEIEEQLKSMTARKLSSTEERDKKNKQKLKAQLQFLSAAKRAIDKKGHPLKTTWDELGFDHIVIDEAHEYKGLWTYSKGKGDKGVKYLGAPSQSSGRAVDLYFKAKAMRDANNGRGIYLLTATPIKNSPVEIYNMLSYTAPDLFRRLGVHNLDQFIMRYCRIEDREVVDEDTGNIKSQRVLVGLKNLKELRRECARYVNRRTATDVGLQLPHNNKEVVHIEPSKEQADFIKWVAMNPSRAAQDYLNAEITPETPDASKIAERYALALPHLTSRAELDMELLEPETYKGYVSPKVKALIDDLKEVTARGEKCVVFCDTVNMPAGKGAGQGAKPNPNGYTFHDKLKKLIADSTGVHPDRIAIVNADTCPDSEDRLKISQGVQNGRYQIVIGNTSTMGQGMNLQHGVANLRHLDVPWNPAVLQQRYGRVIRQGNESSSVANRTYLGTRGLDRDMYNILQGKSVWYNEFWDGHSDSMDTDGGTDYRMTPERLQALAIDDPEERQKAMDDIKLQESIKREIAQRTAAIKRFGQFTQAHQLYEDLRSKPTPTNFNRAESHRAKLAAAKTTLEQLRDRLSRDPAFQPYAAALESPSAHWIEPGTGNMYKAGQRLTIKGTAYEVESFGGDKARLVPINPFTNKKAEGATTKDLPKKSLPSSLPYDRDKALVQAFVAEAANGTDHLPLQKWDEAKREAANHPEAVEAGFRQYDARSMKGHQYYYSRERLVMRDGKPTIVGSADVLPTDRYMFPHVPGDLEALNRARAEELAKDDWRGGYRAEQFERIGKRHYFEMKDGEDYFSKAESGSLVALYLKSRSVKA